jgi:hypothetical protein
MERLVYNLRDVCDKATEFRITNCGIYGGRGEVYTGFWWGNLRERDHLEDPVVDRRVILK